MSLSRSIRPFVPLVIGLAVGGLGATLFLQSMPAPAGSPEERANKLETELKRAQDRIATLEAGDPRAARHRLGRTFVDGARTIAEAVGLTLPPGWDPLDDNAFH